MGKQSTALSNAIVSLNRSSPEALHHQLYEQLRDAILAGQLAPGIRLPSTREFASELAVSRNTVLNAFDQLRAESYLEGHVGDGTYVSRQLPDDLLQVRGFRDKPQGLEGNHSRISNRGMQIASTVTHVAEYDGPPRPFRTSTPALDAFPYKLWSRLTMLRWRERARELLTYGNAAGYLPLREVIAAYLGATRGVRCHPEQLIITSGSQHALEIAVRVLFDSGDAAWIEDPGFLGARAVLLNAGARLVPVPVDEEGINVEAGIEQCPDARLVYVTPSHQYPLGVTLSLRRRLVLLKWASQVKAWIIEDDYDSEFRYAGRPLASLQGLDTEERVIYVGTFSKVLFPAIRIGYIVAPRSLLDVLIRARTLSGHNSPTLDQAVLRDFIADGHFARHVRRMRTIYAERQRALVRAVKRELPDLLTVEPHEAGMHLMGWLPAAVDDHDAYQKALANKVEVTPLSAYCIEPPERGALRLGYTGYTPGQIWHGVRRLGSALRELR